MRLGAVEQYNDDCGMSSPTDSLSQNRSSPATDCDVLLRADKLCKNYPDGDVKALVDVTLEIYRGQYVAIMGPSGSGKSTLLSMLGAIDTPTSGQVWWEEKTLAAWDNLDQLRARMIGFVFQSFYLLPTLTALENVQIPMFGVLPSGHERKKKASALLAAVEMTERAKHMPAQLSVGERQRVAIARALANDPPLLLADEPTGNLDSRTAGEVLDLFARLHRERETTLVVVTHSDEVASRAERIIRVRDGKIEQDTTTG
jgi:putative ABC transport system ATP-binding protein